MPFFNKLLSIAFGKHSGNVQLVPKLWSGM